MRDDAGGGGLPPRALGHPPPPPHPPFDALTCRPIDLLLLHWPRAGPNAVGDTLAAWQGLETALDAGVARAIGVSNFNASMLEVLLPRMRHRPVVAVTALARQHGSTAAYPHSTCRLPCYAMPHARTHSAWQTSDCQQKRTPVRSPLACSTADTTHQASSRLTPVRC